MRLARHQPIPQSWRLSLSRAPSFTSFPLGLARKSVFHCPRYRNMSTAATKHVLVPIANGSEEIEAVCIIDTLRRAGASVVVGAVGGSLLVTCSRGVKITADSLLEDCARAQQWDLVALPGGMPGAEHLRDSSILKEVLQRQKAEHRMYAAICAAPGVVFAPHGLFEGVQQMTAHPAHVHRLPNTQAAEQRVVIDGLCVTSRGPGTALEFSLALVGQLYGAAKMEEVAKPMLAA